MIIEGDFYEDDEPIEDLLRAFEEGEKCVTADPSRGWTYWLGPDLRMHPLATRGARVRVSCGVSEDTQ